MDGDIQQTTDLSIDDVDDGRDTPPHIPSNSPGSSVSSLMKEEYSQLLKYTVESTPGLNTMLSSLQDTETVQSLGQIGMQDEEQEEEALNLNTNTNTNTLAVDQDFVPEDYHKNETCRRSKDFMDLAVEAMRGKLDGWMGTLQENILEELLSSLMAGLESQYEDNRKSTEGIQAEKVKLEKKVNCLTEKVNGFERSLKQKNTLVKNLTDSLVAQKGKVELAKTFYHWKADHYDKQREIFTEKLAVQHHERKLNLRVLKSWYGLIQTRWRSRTERKSQTQAKEVCLNLTSDYETKIAMLNENIASLEKNVSVLQAEREMYSEQVKKAFMRGMCALNMETMSVFGEDQTQALHHSNGYDDTSATLIEEVTTFDSVVTTSDSSGQSNGSRNHHQQVNNSNQNQSLRHHSPQAHPHTHSHTHSPTRIGSGQTHQSPVIASNVGPKVTKSKPKSARGQGHSKIVSASQVLAPPMASVVVERHPAVNKQTMGKATAVRYPKKTNSEIGPFVRTASATGKNKGGMTPTNFNFKPLAGQADSNKDSYIKVVE